MANTAADIQKLYIAYFNRPADPAGLAYWTSSSMTITQIANSFAEQAEYKAAFAGQSTETVVSTLYVNLFGRAAEPAGLLYWVGEIVAGRSTLGSAAINILNGAKDADKVAVDSKVKAASSFTTAIEPSTDAIVAYSKAGGVAAAKTWLGAVTTDATALTQIAAQSAVIQSIIEGSASNVPLTSGTDKLSGTSFEAGLVYTPDGGNRINALQDEDVLTGTGSNNTLNATLGNANDNGGRTITPKLININNINVAFTGSSTSNVSSNAVNKLDLQDTTGLKTLNVSRITDESSSVTIDNMTSVPTSIKLNQTNSPSGTQSFTFTSQAVNGTADTTTFTLNDVKAAGVTLQAKDGATGVETINLVSSGAANNVGVFTAQDVQTLNISGDTALTLGAKSNTTNANQPEAVRYAAGLANVAGSLSKINASALKGALDLTIGTEISAITDNTSGVAVNLAVTGGSGNDIFRLENGVSVGTLDTIVGGAADGTDTNTLVLLGGNTVSGKVTKVQALEIRTGHDGATAADSASVDASKITDLVKTYIRNEGQEDTGGLAGVKWTSASEAATVTLTKLNAAQAGAITIAHGTTGNSALANLKVNLSAASADNATAITLVDGVNQNPVFNFAVNTNSLVTTITDSDTESNSVYLKKYNADGSTEVVSGAGSKIVLNGGATGQYFNLDTNSGDSAAATTGRGSYGYATDGTTGSNASKLAPTGNLDYATSFKVYTSASVDRLKVETFDGSAYKGNIVARFDDVTLADGVSSQTIKGGEGNDTFIFDAQTSESAGFTSADTVSGGTGTDALIIDGNTTDLAGTPRVNHNTSEWDNVTGIDVLRFVKNEGVTNVGNGSTVAVDGGGYYAHIDNDFIGQTDAGNRLTVVNNDGDSSVNSESDLVLDLTGLSQLKFVTFVGANGQGGAAISSNRVIVDDVSANQNMVLDGGDTDINDDQVGNNNVYNVLNTANVSISDLSQTSNFSTIEFTNDQATAQTLNLTLNNTIVEALVDGTSTASTSALAEVLVVNAVDHGAVASALNIDARAVTGFHALNVTGSVAGNDILRLDANVGGSGHTADLLGSTGDRVNWTGGSATMTAAIDLAAGTTDFTVGTNTVNHTINGAEYLDLSGLTYASASITTLAAASTVVGGKGVDTITGGGGNNLYVIGNDGSGITVATADTITNFVVANDTLKLGVAATATNTTIVGAAVADFAAAKAAADAIFAADVGGNQEYAVIKDGANTYVFIDNAANGNAAEQVVVLTGVLTLTTADIIA